MIGRKYLISLAGLLLCWPLLTWTIWRGSHDQAEDLTSRFTVEENWPQLPQGRSIGDVTSFSVDDEDNVWLLHRPRTIDDEGIAQAAPPILKLNSEGLILDAWGGEGAQFEWPQREHFIHVDSEGSVWIGGNYCPGRNLPRLKPLHDDQIIKFRRDKTFALQIGRASRSKGNADKLNLHWPSDAVVHAPTNELYVADGYGNHRVIVLDADSGEFKRMWGAFGNVPEGVAECPKRGAFGTALEMFNPFVDVDKMERAQQFSTPHAIRVSHDGVVYVADRGNRRVQTFTTDGEFIGQIVRNEGLFAHNLALSHDRDQRYLYVGGGGKIAVYVRSSLELIGDIHLPGLIGYGFDHHIATDSKGNLYVAGVFAGLVKLTFQGSFDSRP